MSSLSWLDTSPEEQRRVMVIINAFSEQGTRDELGIGQIRDAISDILFPGMSTLHTRARYLLFVPWLFQRAVRLAKSPDLIPATANTYERQLIEGLRASGAVSGLIGRAAGISVKSLPSTVYWGALTRFGILTRPKTPAELGRHAVFTTETDEATNRPISDWHPTLPAAPAGLPWQVPEGFDLSVNEASWLRERMMSSAPDTYLAHLLIRSEPPSARTATPWDDPAAAEASASIRQSLHGADLFATAMQGASLLYNVMVAERYEREGFDRLTDIHQERFVAHQQWMARAAERRSEFAAWDRHAWWQEIHRQAPRLGTATIHFVDSWLNAVVDGSAFADIAEQSQWQERIIHRERMLKGSLARLVNRKMLAEWSGASGIGLLVFRWPQVRRIVTDIHEGMARAAS